MRLWPKRRTTIPLVRLQGVIGMGSSLRPGLSAASVEAALVRAFAMKGPAVALAINSPGGSPVQSSLIFSRIRGLAQEKKKTVLVFVEDVAASGGYWLATAGDEIIADATSIVGSIGVVTATFGFPELLQKIGVERRVYTMGENKSVLDPFQPEKPSDVGILHAVQADIHAAFIAVVKERRGARLADDPDLFTGRFWSGEAGRALGLVDRIGNLRDVLRERYGARVAVREVPARRPSFLRGRLGLGAALSADSLIGAVRSDRLWDRYGL
ncbi:S49 family peptidase [Acuticoccus mangrovi]|uniref:S49 family peptidase n=1 Tax=Acuticoccus mangrovi TaxID=2796142 RepID=A0A934IDE5_9HYPH|nr:S49 family peptidase [Acuticoccus mangrovi]MBJ3774498.1 S49 family peptidase [Acuticoccus mangrovi]